MRRGSKRNRLLDRWVGVPLLNLAALGRQARRIPERIARVGVLCSPALGDTLLFSAVLRDLRRHFDQSPAGGERRVEIVHLCMKENLAAAELIAGADRRILLHLGRPREGIRALRAERLDVLLDFSSWQRITAFHTLMSGARFTAGFRSARQFRGRAYDLTVEHSSQWHELENFRALLRAVGVEPDADPCIAVADPGQQAWLASWRASATGDTPQGLNGSEAFVVLHPWPAGAQSWLREWPENRWVGLARRLVESERGLAFAITGGPADRPRVDAMVAEFARQGLCCAGFCGSDGLRSVVALLRRARLAVCVNTGIMHLAAILGTPTLGLNGPTAEHRWGPRGRCTRGIGPDDGSGGYLNFGYEYPSKPEDVMSRIAVDSAFAAAQDLMRCGPVL